MSDFWNDTGFEIHEDSDYAGMEIMADGSLEINVCAGTTYNCYSEKVPCDTTITISAGRAPEILAGIQAWIEQLPTS